jgi:hypothetical protein
MNSITQFDLISPLIQNGICRRQILHSGQGSRKDVNLDFLESNGELIKLLIKNLISRREYIKSTVSGLHNTYQLNR